MSQQDQFRLDPVETKITAPISDVSVQQTPTNDTGLQAGVTALSQAMGSLADFAKKRRIQEDTLIAEEAAAREEVMPGGLLPVAQSAYHNVVDINTKAEVLASVKLWTEGDDYLGVIKSDATSREKSDVLKNKFASFKAEGMNSIRNPALLQSFNLEMNELQAAQEKIIYEIEKKDMTVETIQGIKNVITDAKNFAEITGATELADIFNKRWINAMGLDVKKTLPWITNKEARLLAMQTLMQDEDILLRPDIIHDILGEEYSKGFTYSALLIGTGDDADAFRKMHSEYLSDSKALFTKLSTEDKASYDKLVEDSRDAAYQIFMENGATMEAATMVREFLTNSGAFDDKKKLESEMKSFESYFNSAERYGRFSKQYQEVVDLVIKNEITTKHQLNSLLLAKQINTDLWSEVGTLLTEEGEQRKSLIKSYKESTSTMRSQMVSSIKMALSNNKNLSAILEVMDKRKLGNAEMLKLIADSGLDGGEFSTMMNGLQVMLNDMDKLATEWGTRDAATDSPVRTDEFMQVFKEQGHQLLQAARKISELTAQEDEQLRISIENKAQNKTASKLGFQFGGTDKKLPWMEQVKQKNKEVNEAIKKRIVDQAKVNKQDNQKVVEKVNQLKKDGMFDGILGYLMPGTFSPTQEGMRDKLEAGTTNETQDPKPKDKKDSSWFDKLVGEQQTGTYKSGKNYTYDKKKSEDEEEYLKRLLNPSSTPITVPKYQEKVPQAELDKNVDYQRWKNRQQQLKDNVDRIGFRHQSFNELGKLTLVSMNTGTQEKFEVTNASQTTETTPKDIKDNPGNVEEGQGFGGETGELYAKDRVKQGRKPFVVFDTPQMGLRAMFMDIRTKIKSLDGNLLKMITKYAPPEDNNDTKAYYEHVKKNVGGKEKVTEDDLMDIVRTMIKHENKPEVADYYLSDPKILKEAFELSKKQLPSGTTYKEAIKLIKGLEV